MIEIAQTNNSHCSNLWQNSFYFQQNNPFCSKIAHKPLQILALLEFFLCNIELANTEMLYN